MRPALLLCCVLAVMAPARVSSRGAYTSSEGQRKGPEEEPEVDGWDGGATASSYRRYCTGSGTSSWACVVVALSTELAHHLGLVLLLGFSFPWNAV